jgi:hypothetical protein
MNQAEEDPSAETIHRLALALSELIGRRVDVELERSEGEDGLALHGTLTRALVPSFSSTTPTLAVTIGPHGIAIHIAGITDIACRRAQNEHEQLRSVHVLTGDGDALHVKALDQEAS